MGTAADDAMGGSMGQPVVHVEVVGADPAKLRAFYGSLFGWTFDLDQLTSYGIVAREGNVRPDGTGVGGGVGAAPLGYDGHLTFYVEVPDVEAALANAEALGGRRAMGPHRVTDDLEIGQFRDPDGHLVGVLTVIG